MEYEWLKSVAIVSDDLMTIIFNTNFNEIIRP